MNHPTKWAALALVAFLCAGCGTVGNLNPYIFNAKDESQPAYVPRIYGGVRSDWTELEKTFAAGVPRSWFFIDVLTIPADLPLSLIGDTLTLPYTAGAEAVRSINNYYFPPPTTKPEPLKKQSEVSTP